MNTQPPPVAASQAPRRRGYGWAGAPLAIAYALLAAGLGGAVVAAGPRAVLWPPPAFVLPCALAAFCAERFSARARHPLAPNAAPACYMLAVLLFPSPWPVAIATACVVVSFLTVRGVSPRARIAAMAHTVAVVAAFSLVAPRVVGDAGALRHIVALNLPSSMHVVVSSVGAPRGVARATDLWALLALVAGYYLLDTLPRALAGGFVYRICPPRAWALLYRRTLRPSLGALGAGALAATVAHTAPALMVLVGLIVVGLHQAICQGATRQGEEAEIRALRADAAHWRDAADVARDAGPRARLDAVLASVQALARQEDLAEMTRALAEVAARLTPFRSCTVYLCDPRDGAFAPRPAADGAVSGDTAPRNVVAGWMSERNLLGYSYWVRHDRPVGVEPQVWRHTDRLLTPLLLAQGDVIGYLSLDHPTTGYIPTAADLAPLEAVASLAAGVVARRREADAALRLAATDGLTGLLNRRAVEESLCDRLARALQRLRPVALLMIDLDDFGGINNTYGHQVGDAALRLVAEVIRGQLRAGDLGGRYGGDEFVVILPGLDAARAGEIAERLRVALVKATTQAAAEGTLPLIHTSIGVAACPDHGRDGAALMKVADDALYQSKRLGKNCVSFAPAA